MKNKTLFLCGLKNCGKTYYAKMLSEKHPELLWYDSDIQILKLNPTFSSCRELYKTLGAQEFRCKEQQAIESIINELQNIQKNVIISLGGGVCDTNNGLKLASERGILVYLKESEHVLYQRMVSEGLPPYLKEDPEENFHKIYEKRDYSYTCFAKYVINLSEWPQNQVLSELERLLE